MRREFFGAYEEFFGFGAFVDGLECIGQVDVSADVVWIELQYMSILQAMLDAEALFGSSSDESDSSSDDNTESSSGSLRVD